jgi:hypothetical protein
MIFSGRRHHQDRAKGQRRHDSEIGDRGRKHDGARLRGPDAAPLAHHLIDRLPAEHEIEYDKGQRSEPLELEVKIILADQAHADAEGEIEEPKKRRRS